MVKHFDWRKRGPKERQNELSFFDEVTPEQLASYRPDQLRTILLQREKVISFDSRVCITLLTSLGSQHCR